MTRMLPQRRKGSAVPGCDRGYDAATSPRPPPGRPPLTSGVVCCSEKRNSDHRLGLRGWGDERALTPGVQRWQEGGPAKTTQDMPTETAVPPACSTQPWFWLHLNLSPHLEVPRKQPPLPAGLTYVVSAPTQDAVTLSFRVYTPVIRKQPLCHLVTMYVPSSGVHLLQAPPTERAQAGPAAADGCALWR